MMLSEAQRGRLPIFSRRRALSQMKSLVSLILKKGRGRRKRSQRSRFWTLCNRCGTANVVSMYKCVASRKDVCFDVVLLVNNFLLYDMRGADGSNI